MKKFSVYWPDFAPHVKSPFNCTGITLETYLRPFWANSAYFWSPARPTSLSSRESPPHFAVIILGLARFPAELDRGPGEDPEPARPGRRRRGSGAPAAGHPLRGPRDGGQSPGAFEPLRGARVRDGHREAERAPARGVLGGPGVKRGQSSLEAAPRRVRPGARVGVLRGLCPQGGVSGQVRKGGGGDSSFVFLIGGNFGFFLFLIGGRFFWGGLILMINFIYFLGGFNSTVKICWIFNNVFFLIINKILIHN